MQLQDLVSVGKTVGLAVLVGLPAQLGGAGADGTQIGRTEFEHVVAWHRLGCGVASLQGRTHAHHGGAFALLPLYGQQVLERGPADGAHAVVQWHQHRAVGQIQGDGVGMGGAGQVGFVPGCGLQQLRPCPAAAVRWLVRGGALKPLAQARINVGAGRDLAHQLLGGVGLAQLGQGLGVVELCAGQVGLKQQGFFEGGGRSGGLPQQQIQAARVRMVVTPLFTGCAKAEGLGQAGLQARAAVGRLGGKSGWAVGGRFCQRLGGRRHQPGLRCGATGLLGLGLHAAPTGQRPPQPDGQAAGVSQRKGHLG